MTTTGAPDALSTADTGLPLAGPEPAPPWRALPVLLAGTFLVVLDFFGVNVALPSLAAELGADPSAIVWVVAGFALATAATQLLAGRLGDHVGHRRGFAVGLAVFTAASFVCAAAPGATVLVAARVVQGVGAAFIGTSVLSIVGVSFAGGARARALAWYGAVLGVAAAGGQLVGGALIAADVAGLGWRAIFAVNVPVGVLALVLTPRLVPVTRGTRSGRLDVAGMVLGALTMVLLVLPLVQGRQAGWPLWTWVSLALVPVLGTATYRHGDRVERAGGQPLLPPSLLRRPSMSLGLVAQLVYWCGQASFYFVLALYLQDGLGLTPLDAGLVFGVLAVGYLATSFRAPGLAVRHGRRVVVVGLVAILAAYGALGLALVAAPDGTGSTVAALVPGLLLAGAGQGLCIVPLTAQVLAHADPRQAGSVSGALQTAQQAGNSVGVAVVGVVFYGVLGAAGGTVGHAFGASLVALAAVGAAALAAVGLPALVLTRSRAEA
ncbi:MFS transporter [Luteimicrobium xylanilyticum]|uniref:Putative MFS-type transporter YcnB n=1 Tax=Luteimicrobium xylanilyticum TaxID=1133546 RepID=A0A5P9Q8F5_9MICO|nr:MFS transporter [Luteimicrobium xylanilyticum]QFU97694.1 putative MFS-type transporter YcnB [Luteimicrobium xylanilyticum]